MSHEKDQPVTGRGAEGVQLGQRAAIYARVSTVDQSCERQIAELTAFAERGGFEVLGIFKETASGTVILRTNLPMTPILRCGGAEWLLTSSPP